MRIVVVGPCASGKTTLVTSLRALGYDAHSCAQEHSYVPSFWRRQHPDVVVFLDCSVATMQRREGAMWWDEALTICEHDRLRDARQHCHLLIAADDLTPEQVVAKVLAYL